jgi:hypothetical protein
MMFNTFRSMWDKKNYPDAWITVVLTVELVCFKLVTATNSAAVHPTSCGWVYSKTQLTYLHRWGFYTSGPFRG